MLKLAITSEQLGTFYALQSIPAEGGSYLTTTQEGRSYLIDIAENLHNLISDQNNVRIPSEDDIEESWYENLNRQIEDENDLLYDNYFDRTRADFDLSPSDIQEKPIEVSEENLKRLVEYLDDEIVDKYEKGFGTIGNIRFHDVFKNRASHELENAIEEMEEYDLDYTNRANRINDILDIIKENLSSVFVELAREFFMADLEKENTLEKHAEMIREAEEIHYEIAAFMDKFDKMIYNAYRAFDDEDPSVFEELVMAIDQITQMAHHGGPLLEYAQEAPETVKDLDAIIQAKSSPYFTEWIRQQDLLPPEAERALEQSENLSLPISDHDYSDEYYRDPRFQQRQKWEQENIPEYRRLQEDRTPGELAYMNAAEVWDMSQKIMQQRKDLEDAYKAEGKQLPPSVYEDFDLGRLRVMEDWSKGYLGHNLPSFKFSSKLLEFSDKIDVNAPDLSDRIDKLVIANVV